MPAYLYLASILLPWIIWLCSLQRPLSQCMHRSHPSDQPDIALAILPSLLNCQFSSLYWISPMILQTWSPLETHTGHLPPSLLAATIPFLSFTQKNPFNSCICSHSPIFLLPYSLLKSFQSGSHSTLSSHTLLHTPPVPKLLPRPPIISLHYSLWHFKSPPYQIPQQHFTELITPSFFNILSSLGFWETTLFGFFFLPGHPFHFPSLIPSYFSPLQVTMPRAQSLDSFSFLIT